MASPESFPQSYAEGIVLAEKQGMIRYYGDRAAHEEKDRYGHLPTAKFPERGISGFNTYEMLPVAVDLLRYTQRMRMQREIFAPQKACFVGAGHGFECVEAHKIGAEITTSTLSNAINPYLHLKTDWNTLFKKILWSLRSPEAPFRLSTEDDRRLNQSMCHWNIDPDFLVDIQRKYDVDIYDHLSTDRPYIHEQHVGDFTTEADISAASKDFVHENMGGVFYAADQDAAIKKAVGLASENGAAFFGSIDKESRSILYENKDRGDIVLTDKKPDAFLILKAGHPATAEIRKSSENPSRLTLQTFANWLKTRLESAQ